MNSGQVTWFLIVCATGFVVSRVGGFVLRRIELPEDRAWKWRSAFQAASAMVLMLLLFGPGAHSLNDVVTLVVLVAGLGVFLYFALLGLRAAQLRDEKREFDAENARDSEGEQRPHDGDV